MTRVSISSTFPHLHMAEPQVPPRLYPFSAARRASEHPEVCRLTRVAVLEGGLR